MSLLDNFYSVLHELSSREESSYNDKEKLRLFYHYYIEFNKLDNNHINDQVIPAIRKKIEMLEEFYYGLSKSEIKKNLDDPYQTYQRFNQVTNLLLPDPAETEPNAAGILTKVEYRYNKKGWKEKVTSEIRRSIRRKIKPFGRACRKNNSLVTQVSPEEVFILPPGVEEEVVKPIASFKCDNCGVKDDHFTAMCPKPRKISLTSAEDERPKKEDDEYLPAHIRKRIQARYQGREGQDSEKKTIRISNIDTTVDRNDLETLVRQYPGVKIVKLITDRNTGENRGFAFVDFYSTENAEFAMKQLHGSRLGYSIISTEWAKKRKTDNSGYRPPRKHNTGYGKDLAQQKFKSDI